MGHDREYEKRTTLDVPPEEVFAYHESPGALERLTPPWERFRVVHREGGIRDGARMVARVAALGPIGLTWEALHRDYVEGRQFRDEQVRGPFARWVHTHRMEPVDGGTELVDHVGYRLPMGALGDLFGRALVRRKLERMFRYRHRVTATDVRRHHRAGRDRAMRVAITGASGLIGRHLTGFLRTGGHEVIRLVRSREAAEADDAVFWKPSEGEIDREGLRGADAVVHLAGESIFGRWTDAKKTRVWKSRVDGTRLVAEALAGMEDGPKVLVSSSGINYYGNTGDTMVDETAPRGSGFLAELSEAWEEATRPASDAGVRVVILRTAVVLSPEGGALKAMLPAFKGGVGGRIGKGDQWMSWISIDDMAGAIHHALITDELRGPVNATSPNPVTNRQFTDTLGRVLSRPTVLPVPGFAVKAVFGKDAANEMLLGGVRAEPGRLRQTGFEWAQPDLETALRHVLGK